MCQHESITIIETGSWFTEHYRDGSGGWSHNNEPGDYQKMVKVVCPDCGFNGKYSRLAAPKWLQRYLDELIA